MYACQPGSSSSLSMFTCSSGHPYPASDKSSWLTREMRSPCFLRADELMADVDTG